MSKNIILFTTRLLNTGLFSGVEPSLFQSEELMLFFKDREQYCFVGLKNDETETKEDIKEAVKEAVIREGMDGYDAEKLDLNDAGHWEQLKQNYGDVFTKLEQKYKEALEKSGLISKEKYIKKVEEMYSNPCAPFLKERFSIYSLTDADTALYAVLPLKSPCVEKLAWEKALLSEIRARNSDAEHIILALHDLDIGPQRPFSVVCVDKGIKDAGTLTECVFQHSATDPIKSILEKKHEKECKKDIFESVKLICSKLGDMTQFGKDHKTRKAYEAKIKSLQE